jgi:hypothetical protein
MLVDTVLENPFPCERWEEKFEIYQFLIYKGYSPKFIHHHTGETREIVWWITLCGGMDCDSDSYQVTLWRMRDLSDLCRFRQFESWLKTPTLDKNHLAPEVLHFNQIFRNATYGRSLIFTERGYIVRTGPKPISSLRSSHDFPWPLLTCGTFSGEQLLTPPVPRDWLRHSAKRVTLSLSSLVEKYHTSYGPEPLRNLQEKTGSWADAIPLSEMHIFMASWMGKH